MQLSSPGIFRKTDGLNSKWTPEGGRWTSLGQITSRFLYSGCMWDSVGSGAGQVFSQLDTRESHLGRGSIRGGIAFLSVSKSGAFSRFMVDVGGPSLLWIDSPGQGIWACTKKSG